MSASSVSRPETNRPSGGEPDTRDGGPGGPADVLALVGPTASGKTSLALSVARLLPCEIISADSRQIYREMAVGTAQPTQSELREVPHHFIADLPPDGEFDSGLFGTMGRRLVGEILHRGRVPLVVGGSGLYLRSLLRGLFDGPGALQEVRERLEERLEAEGADRLLEELRQVDPVAASKFHPTNTRRIIRALEVYHLSGRTITDHHRTPIEIPFRSVQIGLRWPRPLLYGRINARVIEMVNEGLVEETRRLLELGYPPGLRSLQTVGFREAVAHIGGRINRQEMIALIQMNSRRYAKRQLTWFRADQSVEWIDIDSADKIPHIASDVVVKFSEARRGG